MKSSTIILLLWLLLHMFNLHVLTEGKACESLQYVELGSMGTLNCSAFDADFIGVWWYNTSINSTDELLIYSLESVKGGVGFISGQYDIDPSGSLVIQTVSFEHEGFFKVKYLQSQKVDPVKYEVHVMVLVIPVPANPIVEGCNQEQNCVLIRERQGILTCTVKGSRPVPTVEWSTFYDNESSLISFTNDQVKIVENGDTFDVSLSSEYRVSQEARERLIIKCKASLPNIETLDLKATNVTLLFTSATERERRFYLVYGVVSFAVVIVLILGLYFLYYCCYKKRRRESPTQGTSDEELQTLHHFPKEKLTFEDGTMNENLEANRELFIQELKDAYESLYQALQPIPYLKDKLSSVNTVFVDPGIQILKSAHAIQGHEIWEDLQSYQELLKDDPRWKKKRILEADLGFGKSTLALQILYVWCNHGIEDVKLLLFLRLRECKTIKSLYEAIKKNVLPRDSTLTDNNIKDIINKTKSVLILLDGFEDYTESWKATTESDESDFHKIIKGQMLQKCMIVLTTKTSVLPKKSLHLMERFKLTGFNDDARRNYIRQAMEGNDDKAEQRIEQLLEGNSIISDLCQSPLIFVILAHMISANKSVQDLRSVTKCVRFMLSGIHSHMKNKLKEGGNSEYESSETSSRTLNKLAYESLIGNKRTAWTKEELIKIIGEAVYEQYQQTGILVEKERVNIDISDESGKFVQEKTEVTFYHKIFCEWYAAHHLSVNLQTTRHETASKCLESLHPSRFQYLYQFACGLNIDSAKRIIEHLVDKRDTAKFAIPCIMEQESNIDILEKAVGKLCQDGIIISGHHNLLLQRSSMDVLNIATKRNLSIEYVELYNCFKSVNLSKGEIILRSGLCLSKDVSVKKLCVNLTDTPMTVEDRNNMLNFSSMCSTLKVLCYRNCGQPSSYNDTSVLSSLNKKRTKVKWQCSNDDGDQVFLLNLKSGRWENEYRNSLTSSWCDFFGCGMVPL